mmetsp:Transcript_94041/g.261786  ORF Transcript_94041/g.261786 Transcript_94041/m.261786 type:complete len:282 (-) Transcript_94041:949-1794(-)
MTAVRSNVAWALDHRRPVRHPLPKTTKFHATMKHGVSPREARDWSLRDRLQQARDAKEDLVSLLHVDDCAVLVNAVVHRHEAEPAQLDVEARLLHHVHERQGAAHAEGLDAGVCLAAGLHECPVALRGQAHRNACVELEGVHAAVPLQLYLATPELGRLEGHTVRKHEWAPRPTSAEAAHLIIQVFHICFDALHYVFDFVERRQPDVTRHSGLRTNLVQRALGAINLRGLHVRTCGKLIRIFAGMRREVIVETRLHNGRGLHGQLNAVNRLVRESTVEEAA